MKEKVLTFSSLEPCTAESLAGHRDDGDQVGDHDEGLLLEEEPHLYFLLWFSLSASLSLVLVSSILLSLQCQLCQMCYDTQLSITHEWHLDDMLT